MNIFPSSGGFRRRKKLAKHKNSRKLEAAIAGCVITFWAIISRQGVDIDNNIMHIESNGSVKQTPNTQREGVVASQLGFPCGLA